MDTIEGTRPIRPTRWRDYLHGVHDDLEEKGGLWNEFEPVIPFAIIDRRLVDIAKDFWSNPDEKLMTAVRRLEDVVRKRTSSAVHGTKLFSQAFHPNDGRLGWPTLDPGEQTGRMNLFVGTYMAYRNPRAHCEPIHNRKGALLEFLLINHLYCLEHEAIDRVATSS
jgi:uncharacterized protein (TIGR02391 family)